VNGPDKELEDDASTAWNARPLEDALAAELQTAQAFTDGLIWHLRQARQRIEALETLQERSERWTGDICLKVVAIADLHHGFKCDSEEPTMKDAVAAVKFMSNKIEKYEKALQFYADQETYKWQSLLMNAETPCGGYPVIDDSGDIARTALAPTTPES
jgi:hypothetical protein